MIALLLVFTCCALLCTVGAWLTDRDPVLDEQWAKFVKALTK